MRAPINEIAEGIEAIRPRDRDRILTMVDPILHSAVAVAEYEPGTWGSAAARAVVAGEEGWHDPKPEETPPC